MVLFLIISYRSLSEQTKKTGSPKGDPEMIGN